MTKSEAKKWGTTIENTTGSSGDVSQKVCGKGTGSTGTKCGTTDSAATKISDAFSTEGTDAATQLSADTNNVSTSGMANNINGLTKDEKAIVAGA